MTYELKKILLILEKKKSQRNIDGMARFGINTHHAFGVSVVLLRTIAKKVGKNHNLALELWDTGYHESRILAAFIGEADKLTESQMERWVRDFDSWDVCDTVCGSLFDKAPFAYKKALEWTESDKEFVKRAGFVMYAWFAVHDKKQDNQTFIDFLEVIKKYANDDRNFVKKAVNWSLRQIGKRNEILKKEAIKAANQIVKMDSKSAKWIAKDALRELKKCK